MGLKRVRVNAGGLHTPRLTRTHNGTFGLQYGDWPSVAIAPDGSRAVSAGGTNLIIYELTKE